VEGEACLVRLRPSSEKGGTIIAEDVTDAAMHERRLYDPDGYRPRFCPRCQGHLGSANLGGAESMLQRALKRFDRYPGRYYGFDLGGHRSPAVRGTRREEERVCLNSE
jgi:hypothetical protein